MKLGKQHHATKSNLTNYSTNCPTPKRGQAVGERQKLAAVSAPFPQVSSAANALLSRLDVSVAPFRRPNCQ